MVLNITGVDNQLYYDVNIALNVCFFIFLSLLPLLLCVLVILALVLAKTINIKIRALLINVFAADILNWISNAIFFLDWIVRLNYIETISCKLIYATYLMVSFLKCFSATLYAINIILFIKYGEKKLKWSVIIPSIVLSWVMISIISILVLPLFPPDIVQYLNGICFTIFLYTFYLVVNVLLSVLLSVVSFVFLIVQIIMAIITFVYIKKHTLEGNVQIKKAVAKVLVYIVIASILGFIGTIAPAVTFIIELIVTGSDIVPLTARSYIHVFIFGVPGIATPLVAIALLKPLRDAIKTIPRNLFCKRDNTFHNTLDTELTNIT